MRLRRDSETLEERRMILLKEWKEEWEALPTIEELTRSSCPKCGHDQYDIRWHRGHDVSLGCPPCGAGRFEHIAIQCWRCSHQRAARTRQPGWADA